MKLSDDLQIIAQEVRELWLLVMLAFIAGFGSGWMPLSGAAMSAIAAAFGFFMAGLIVGIFIGGAVS